jgi:ABC-2 type transport system permease protein
MLTGASLSVYPRFARCAFQRRAAYRLANWTGVAVNFFFFLVHAQVFFAFFAGRARVAGWSVDEAVRYFATSEALAMVLGVLWQQSLISLAERIRSGDVAVDLARPVHLWMRYLAEGYGTAIYYAATRMLVLYSSAMLLYQLPLPRGPALLWSPISVAFGVGIVAALGYLAAATAFWIEHAHGPIGAAILLLSFFGGLVVPLDFYPEPARVLADVLPFRGGVYTPIAITNGTLHGGALWFGLIHQVVWLALLLWLAHAVEERGMRHLAAHGG